MSAEDESFPSSSSSVGAIADSVGQALPPPPSPFGAISLGLLKPPGFKRSTNSDLQKSWTLHEFPMYLGQDSVAPRERIRQLDRLRFHNLHPEDECVILRLPSRRVDIQSMKDVILLCGGFVGVRFDGTELKAISDTTKDLEKTWTQLDALYKSIPSAVTKDSSQLDADKAAVVAEFHALCDNYIRDLQVIQQIVRDKQATIDKTAETLKVDADPDSKIGSPFPKWLSTLRDKYLQHVATQPQSKPEVPMRNSSFPLGKFSVFLSLCMNETFAVSQDEKAALDELLEASRDCTEIFQSKPVHLRATNPEVRVRYFARRFYTFLTSVTELRSAVRDESSIESLVHT